MLVQDAQREVRTVFVGGFWGQLVSSIIWLVSAALATWSSPRAGIWMAIVSGFFHLPDHEAPGTPKRQESFTLARQSSWSVGHASCLGRRTADAIARTYYRVSLDPLLSRADGNHGRALLSIYISIRDANFLSAGCISCRVRSAACVLCARVLQPGRLDRRCHPVRVCVDRTERSGR